MSGEGGEVAPGWKMRRLPGWWGEAAVRGWMGGVAARHQVARWWPLMRVSRGSSSSVEARIACRPAACTRVQTATSGSWTSRGADGVAARGERLSRPNQCAAVIHRGVSERVPARDSVGNQGGHAQSVHECYRRCAQICPRTRKCSGDTSGNRHHLCRVRPRVSPGPTHDGLHGGAAGGARTRRRGDVPPTLPPTTGGEQSSGGEDTACAGGCRGVRCPQSAPTGARGRGTSGQGRNRRA